MREIRKSGFEVEAAGNRPETALRQPPTLLLQKLKFFFGEYNSLKYNAV
jgi:hypothetical protein